MQKHTYKILVVGPASGFGPLLEELAERGYRSEAVADVRTASTYLLRHSADAALLGLPADSAEARMALEWLRAAKEELPVVVVSSEADMQPYLAAMESGAFDYFTRHTPLAEIERVLAAAIRWRQQKVA